MVKITTKPYKYFFSGSLYIQPGKSIEVEPRELTETELEDILQGLFLENLIASDMEALLRAHADKVSGISTTVIENNSTTINNLNTKLESLENTVNHLTIGEVSSVVFWGKTEW